MGISAGLAAFKLSYELSPVILTGGIATALAGGALPIIALTEALNFTAGILEGGDDLDLDDFFAHFGPLPGSTLIDNQLGEYPFANQSVAANAVIAQPLIISLRMICPVSVSLGWAGKLATMMALQATLQQHGQSGGTYTVATPSFFYSNCVLLRITDTSNTDSEQPQNTYQWDFRKPLLTLQDAEQAQSGLMSQLTAGSTLGGGTPSWSGLGPTVGNASTASAPGIVPSAAGPAGGGIASGAPAIGSLY